VEEAVTISPDRILKELADLWVTMGKEGQAESAGAPGASVLRACTMTLIVMGEASEDTSAIGETMAALMPEHPARTVLVRLCGREERTLSERVYAQCWMPFGQRRQICCEQVEITAADAALPDLPSVILPLAVADLPVILWCRAPRLLGMPEFRQIASMATKVVVDSTAMPDAKQALARMSAASGRGVMLGDLAWTRLTRWREMLSQVFENRERLSRLATVNRVRIEYGPGYETSARYMAAWIAEAVPARAELLPFEGTLRMELDGENLRVSMARSDGTLTVSVNELTHRTSLPHPSEYLLMREEMGIVRRDLVFERALASAAVLAYPEDK
jgi:glucose-6-phosphate dehydrogenase assembly protein OpcA